MFVLFYLILLLYCFTALLLYCFTALLLYCFTALLLYCFTALLLYCFTALLLYCLVTVATKEIAKEKVLEVLAWWGDGASFLATNEAAARGLHRVTFRDVMLLAE